VRHKTKKSRRKTKSVEQTGVGKGARILEWVAVSSFRVSFQPRY